jgi:hypothetical protein
VSYYYLASSLPALTLGEPPPISLEAFRASIEPILKEEDLAEFDCVTQGRFAEASSAFARAWHDADTQVRNAVARARANRRSADVKPFLQEHEGFSVTIDRMVTDAYAKPNPLERDLELDRVRWKLLGDMATEAPFGLPAILAFAKQLQLAQRWAAMDEEQGQERVEAFIRKQIAEEGTLVGQAGLAEVEKDEEK